MPSLEQRVSDLEAKVARLLREPSEPQDGRWWNRHFGAFENDPMFDSAVRRGEEYRKSQPIAADSPEALRSARTLGLRGAPDLPDQIEDTERHLAVMCNPPFEILEGNEVIFQASHGRPGEIYRRIVSSLREAGASSSCCRA